MKTLHSLLLALVAVLLGACAAPNVPPGDEAKIRNLGVALLVPESAGYNYLGITVFGNEQDRIAMGDDIANTIWTSAASRLAQSRPDAASGNHLGFWRLDAREYGLSRLLSADAKEKLAVALRRLVAANTQARMKQLGF